jgi:hypothetical protein
MHSHGVLLNHKQEQISFSGKWIYVAEVMLSNTSQILKENFACFKYAEPRLKRKRREGTSRVYMKNWTRERNKRGKRGRGIGSNPLYVCVSMS